MENGRHPLVALASALVAKATVQTLVVEQTGTSIALLPVTNVTAVQQLSVIQPNQQLDVVFQPVS